MRESRLSQYGVPALPVAAFRHATRVRRAVDFLRALQPTGSYILSRRGGDDIVPMDVAHAALALCKTGEQESARAALEWLLTRQVGAGGNGTEVAAIANGHQVDYTGSWYDHYDLAGKARTDLTRGRGEEVGLVLIGVAALAREEPGYLGYTVGGEPVARHVARAARYLSSHAVQRADGRFAHRPDYRVSFHEEAARMGLGLVLAADLLDAAGLHMEGARARAHGELGLAALAHGAGLDHGMAYDYFARTLWSLTSDAAAQEELARTRAAGLVSHDGILHYDWQRLRARTARQRLGWWARTRVIAPAESFDWGIANVVAGDLRTALRLEATWLRRQRPDGGFAGGYAGRPRVGFGAPTSYAVARFILFERLLTAVLPPQRSPGKEDPTPG